MDKAGIARILLAFENRADVGMVLALARAHPDRITASIGLKMHKFIASDAAAVAGIRRLGRNPRFGALSELMILHQQKRDLAPLIITKLNSPASHAALDITAERGWPLVIHIEFGFADRDGEYDRYMQGLEALLAAHPGRSFALTHMGQLDADAARRLIAAHPNLYFLTSHANSVFTTYHRSNQPWTELFSGERLAADWRALFVAHPDRFVLAFDNVYSFDWAGDYYARQAALWRAALNDLPPPVAEAVAHGNAERLWHLGGAARVRPASGPAEIVGPAGLTASQVIARNDRNGDGRLDRAEFGRPALFARIDADHDGFLSAQEFATHWRRLGR